MTPPDPEATASSRAFAAKASQAMALRFGLLAVNLALALLLARSLGPEHYGAYIFAFSLLVLLALPGQAGLPMVMIRTLSARRIAGDLPGARAIIARSRVLVLIYCAILGLGLALAALTLAPGVIPKAEAQILLWSIPLMPAFILLRVTGASLRAFDHLTLGQVLETLSGPALFLFAAAILVLPLGQDLTAQSAMALQAVTATTALIVALWLQHRCVPTAEGVPATPVTTHSVLKGLAPFTLIAGLQAILGKTDILMIRAFLGPAEVGFYHVALQWAGLVLVAQHAVMMTTTPALARAWLRQDQAQVQTLLRRAARIIVLGALPFGLILLAFGPEIIALSFGASYAPAFAALWVLILGRLLQSVIGAVVPLAKIIGWEGLMLKLVAGAALANVALNAALIPSYGIQGAALASILANSAWKLALLVLVARRLGLFALPIMAVPRSKPEAV